MYVFSIKMPSCMDLLGPLTATERFEFNFFLDNKIMINYIELIGFMNELLDIFYMKKLLGFYFSIYDENILFYYEKSFCTASAYHGFTFPN